MSKYSGFAQQLDELFKKARYDYAAAFEALQQARSNAEAARRWDKPEQYEGERAARQAQADAALKAAEAKFRAEGNRIWPDFVKARDGVKKSLEASVQADSVANPDDLDPNGIKLLESGILTADDFVSLAERYANNLTMKRLIAKYAKEMVDGLKPYSQGRGKLFNVIKECESADEVIEQWNDLSSVADVCAGRATLDKTTDPAYVISMGKRWDGLTADAIANF